MAIEGELQVGERAPEEAIDLVALLGALEIEPAHDDGADATQDQCDRTREGDEQ